MATTVAERKRHEDAKLPGAVARELKKVKAQNKRMIKEFKQNKTCEAKLKNQMGKALWNSYDII